MLQPFTRVVPGFDCMFAPCQHEVKGEHGICGDRILHALKTELPDGRAVFLVLRLRSDRMPLTVPATWITRPMAPHPIDIALHVQAEVGEACDWMGPGGKCEVLWDTYTGALELVGDIFPEQPHSEPLFEHAKAGPEAMWQRMRDKLEQLLADPNLFPQPDETDTMRDVRTRYDQAKAGLEAASRQYQVAQKDLWHAIGNYTKRDPGYRR